jgi:hypothetical protein
MVAKMDKYVTISVPIEVKKALEKAKGKNEWGEFLFNLYKENEKLKSKMAFEKLVDILTKEDLDAISKSSKEFREGFVLR